MFRSVCVFLVAAQLSQEAKLEANSSDISPSKNDTQRQDEQPLREKAFAVSGEKNCHGYPFEAHTVETKDGYLLQLHRFPSSPQSMNKTSRQPVLLMHGLVGSSASWVALGPNKSLAYLLADVGYDVWMGNSRGNHYSRRHKIFDPDRNRSRFWNFDWHEIGIFDLPSMIDYILNITTFKKLHYAGHSQGTTSFFVMTSERPEYNNKILLMQALAPVAYMKNVQSPIARLSVNMLDVAETATKMFGHFEIAPGDDTLSLSIQSYCLNETAATKNACRSLVYAIGGDNVELSDEKQFPLLLKGLMDGGSSRQFLHYGQLIRSDGFRQYDWGKTENINRYGSHRPPDYNLKKITAPVALHFGRNDWLAAVADVKRLRAKLPNVIDFYEVPHPHFNHFNFLDAKPIHQLLYNRIVKLFNEKNH